MIVQFFKKYNRAFFEILFLRFRSEDIRSFNLLTKIVLYLSTAALFYAPILYALIRSSIENPTLISYYVTVAVLHIFAKFMLNNSKRIQARFSAIRDRKSLLMRIWLVIEYVVFMWLVYLTYPIACILMPFSLIAMSIERFLGSSALSLFFINYPEQFLLWGGIAAYFIFILADGYKKLRVGFLPDYLGLYAVLTIVSASMEKWVTVALASFPPQFRNNRVLFIFSQVFRLSNDAMNIVASAVTFLFAVFSLYTTCGRDQGILSDTVVVLNDSRQKKRSRKKKVEPLENLSSASDLSDNSNEGGNGAGNGFEGGIGRNNPEGPGTDPEAINSFSAEGGEEHKGGKHSG